jgi:hypothetical protein
MKRRQERSAGKIRSAAVYMSLTEKGLHALTEDEVRSLNSDRSRKIPAELWIDWTGVMTRWARLRPTAARDEIRSSAAGSIVLKALVMAAAENKAPVPMTLEEAFAQGSTGAPPHDLARAFRKARRAVDPDLRFFPTVDTMNGQSRYAFRPAPDATFFFLLNREMADAGSRLLRVVRKEATATKFEHRFGVALELDLRLAAKVRDVVVERFLLRLKDGTTVEADPPDDVTPMLLSTMNLLLSPERPRAYGWLHFSFAPTQTIQEGDRASLQLEIFGDRSIPPIDITLHRASASTVRAAIPGAATAG